MIREAFNYIIVKSTIFFVKIVALENSLIYFSILSKQIIPTEDNLFNQDPLSRRSHNL
jgi:hypothetical protein